MPVQGMPPGGDWVAAASLPPASLSADRRFFCASKSAQRAYLIYYAQVTPSPEVEPCPEPSASVERSCQLVGPRSIAMLR